MTKTSRPRRISPNSDTSRRVGDLVAKIDTPEGRELALAEIRRHGTPLYGSDPQYPGLIVEVSLDGTVRVGKLVDRKFIPTETVSALPGPLATLGHARKIGSALRQTNDSMKELGSAEKTRRKTTRLIAPGYAEMMSAAPGDYIQAALDEDRGLPRKTISSLPDFAARRTKAVKGPSPSVVRRLGKALTREELGHLAAQLPGATAAQTAKIKKMILDGYFAEGRVDGGAQLWALLDRQAKHYAACAHEIFSSLPLVIYEAGMSAFANDEMSLALWMCQPAKSLGGAIPAMSLRTAEGRKSVLRTLTAIDRGE